MGIRTHTIIVEAFELEVLLDSCATGTADELALAVGLADVGRRLPKLIELDCARVFVAETTVEVGDEAVIPVELAVLVAGGSS